MLETKRAPGGLPIEFANWALDDQLGEFYRGDHDPFFVVFLDLSDKIERQKMCPDRQTDRQ